jgi:hypothetical protein
MSIPNKKAPLTPGVKEAQNVAAISPDKQQSKGMHSGLQTPYILHKLRKPKSERLEEMAIYCRVSYDGKRATEFSTRLNAFKFD